MPPLIRLYLRQVAIGFALAMLFTGLLLALDVAHLRHLVTHTQGGAVAVLMLVVFNGIVFSGVQFGIAVMRLADDPPTDRPGRAVRANPRPLPAPVGARRG